MLTHATGWVVVMGIGILLPSIAAEFQLSYGMQGLLASGPFWANTVLYIPLSIWLVRYSPKLLTTITLVLGMMLLFFQASSSLFAVLLVSRFAFGITIPAREPARMLLMQQWFPSREFLWANAITVGILSLGLFGATMMTPYLLDFFGGDWRSPLYFFGGVTGGMTILWVILGQERESQQYLSHIIQMGKTSWGNALRHKELWLAGLGVFGANISASTFAAFYPTLMLERYAFPLGFSALVIASNWLVAGVSGLIISKLATDWNTRSRILYTCGLFLPFSYLALIFTDSLPLLVVASIVNGIGWSFFPILLTVSLQLPGIQVKEVPIAHAYLFTAVSLGMAVGPLITGFALEALSNPPVVFGVMSLASLSVIGSGIFVKSLKESETPQITPRRK
jgi:MFS family permease